MIPDARCITYLTDGGVGEYDVTESEAGDRQSVGRAFSHDPQQTDIQAGERSFGDDTKTADRHAVRGPLGHHSKQPDRHSLQVAGSRAQAERHAVDRAADVLSRLPQRDVQTVDAFEIPIAPVESQAGPPGRAAEADSDAGYAQVEARPATVFP